MILIVPRKKRKAVVRRKRSAARQPGRHAAVAHTSPQQRWVRAIGAGTLVLSPICAAVGWPTASDVAAAPAAFSRPDPQYSFGFLEGRPPAGIGATGQKARTNSPSPVVVRRAGSLANHSSQPGLPLGKLGIPGVVLQAYMRAQQILQGQQPGCHMPWWLVAGIGKVESDHADNGAVDRQGNTLMPILGPALNGSGDFAAISAPGGGWTRAEGPMQFLPSTWQEWGGDGNPNNVNDAALAAGRYLCAGGRDLSQGGQQAAAVFSYNPSDSYVQMVLTWAYAYSSGVVPVSSATLPSGLGMGSGGASPAGGNSAKSSGGSGSGSQSSGGSGSGGSASSGSGGSGSSGSGSGGGSTSPVGTSPVPPPSAPNPVPAPPAGVPTVPVSGVTGKVPLP